MQQFFEFDLLAEGTLHRAKSDTQATAELFIKMMSAIPEEEAEELPPF